MTNEVAKTDEAMLAEFLAAADSDTESMDPEAVKVEIVKRILRAETVDDVLEGSSATHARDFLRQPFALTGYKFNRSTIDGTGPKFYMILEGSDANGEKVTITCGAVNVMAQAFKLQKLGALPVQLQIEESPRPTSEGYRPMWLAKAERAF